MPSVIIEMNQLVCFRQMCWHGPPLNAQYLELFSFSKLNHALVQLSLILKKSSFFHLPLSVEGYDQYQLLLSNLEPIHLNHNNDKWNYTWGSSMFMSSIAYSYLLCSVVVSPVYRWLWNSSCLPKRNFFLVSNERSSKHKRTLKKKKYVFAKL